MQHQIEIIGWYDPDGADCTKVSRTKVLHDYKSEDEFMDTAALLIEELIGSIIEANLLPLNDVQSIDACGRVEEGVEIEEFTLTEPIKPSDMTEEKFEIALGNIRDHVTSCYDACLKKAQERFLKEGA